MPVVLCGATNCRHNRERVCQLEEIHIVRYFDELDCARFELDWGKQAKQDHPETESEE